MLNIGRSTSAYEAWLKQQLGGSLVAKDLQRKHEKMRKDGPFAFLRASYWRWAETVLEVCPQLASAPSVLAVGDIHLENFGTWRDAEGRLIWGVNDFDEAAEMPYAIDLVRLATSALLAHARQDGRAEQISRDLLRGYRKGLAAPSPIVLDRKYRWLRRIVVVSEDRRRDFWEKIHREKPKRAPPRYRKLLADSLPRGHAEACTAPRTAGTGSLGRPRWIAVAEWNGGEVVREAKALVLSGWCRAHARGTLKLRCKEIGNGRYRAPDPWLTFEDDIVVRRLSPNNRKIEADDPALARLSAQAAAGDGAGAGERALGRPRPPQGDPAGPREARDRLAGGKRPRHGSSYAGRLRRVRRAPRPLIADSIRRRPAAPSWPRGAPCPPCLSPPRRDRRAR